MTTNKNLSNIKDKYKNGVAINTKLVTDDVYLRNAIKKNIKLLVHCFMVNAK